jgi:hypothetical protein
MRRFRQLFAAATPDEWLLFQFFAFFTTADDLCNFVIAQNQAGMRFGTR